MTEELAYRRTDAHRRIRRTVRGPLHLHERCKIKGSDESTDLARSEPRGIRAALPFPPGPSKLRIQGIKSGCFISAHSFATSPGILSDRSAKITANRRLCARSTKDTMVPVDASDRAGYKIYRAAAFQLAR